MELNKITDLSNLAIPGIKGPGTRCFQCGKNLIVLRQMKEGTLAAKISQESDSREEVFYEGSMAILPNGSILEEGARAILADLGYRMVFDGNS